MSVSDVAVRRESGSESIVELSASMAAIALGILALSGFAPTRLALIALLELGCFSHLMSAVIVGAQRPSPAIPAGGFGDAAVGGLAAQAGTCFPIPAKLEALGP